MTQVKIAVAMGDGAAPEMMIPAMNIAEAAAKLDGIEIQWVHTSMGWNAFEKHGDTFPAESFNAATKYGWIIIGTIIFLIVVSQTVT